MMVAAGERAITEFAVVGGGEAAVHALRRLPPAAGRVRAAGDAGPPRRSRRACARPRRWARCCRMAFGPINLGGAVSAAGRGCGLGDPPRARAAGSRWSRSSWAPALARSPSASPIRWRSTTATCRASHGRACRAMPGGWCSGSWAACRSPACQGRAHLYEGVGPAPLNTLVRTLKAIGCRALLLTNAVGLAAARARAGIAGADRGPHQPAGHQPAGRGRTTRRSGRASST